MRIIMDELSDISCDLRYRGYPCVKTKTSLAAAAALLRQSRSWANFRRRVHASAGVVRPAAWSLRAIPWIFALDAEPSDAASGWSASTALQKVIEDGKQNELETMCRDTGHSSHRLGMLRWSSKAPVAGGILRSCARETRAAGRVRAARTAGSDIKVVQDIANDPSDGRSAVDLPSLIQLRNICRPLNVLQAELLHRSRLAEEEGKDPIHRVEQALMVTIARCSGYMRNTG